MKNTIANLLRRLILRENASSDSKIRFLRSKGVAIGDGTYFFAPKTASIDLTRPYLLTIGERVNFTHGVIVLTHDYSWDVFRDVYDDVVDSAAPVSIGNNVFLGMNCVIMKGVSIGDNSIIGAGSIVSKSIPANSVAAGNPAKVKCTLSEFYEKRKNQFRDEAKALVFAYYSRYGKLPSESALIGFHRLFTPRTPENALRYQIEGEFARTFFSSVPEWNGYDELLKAVCSEKGIPDPR